MKVPSPLPAALILGLAMTCPADVRAGFIPLDPSATYLHTNEDAAAGATAYSLASLGLQPGGLITLTEVGTYNRGPGYGDDSTDLEAVFSSTNVLLDPSNESRVPGAIGVGVDPIVTLPTYFGNQATDIPQDFAISPFGSPAGSSVTLAIPTGAAYLFFSTDDNLFSDNVSPGNTFGVLVDSAAVPEPPSLALGLIGMVGLLALARGRKVSMGAIAR